MDTIYLRYLHPSYTGQVRDNLYTQFSGKTVFGIGVRKSKDNDSYADLDMLQNDNPTLKFERLPETPNGNYLDNAVNHMLQPVFITFPKLEK